MTFSSNSLKNNSLKNNSSSEYTSSSKMLNKLGLLHNPFTDRTAEKSSLCNGAFYLHSDLQGFKLVFFGF